MKKMRMFGTVGTMLLAGGLLAGCGGGSAPASSTGGADGGSGSAGAAGAQKTDAPAKPAEPLNLTLMMDQSNGIPPEGSEVLKQLEEYTNTKLQITWVPHANYKDKLSIVLASGEMPKGVYVTYTPNVVSAMQDGQFWEIGPLLKNYPNLSKFDPAYFSNIAVQGKEYGIPDYRPLGRDGLVYRKDLADELGIKEPPKTIDEWLDAFRKQVKAHPGTYGTADTKELSTFDRFVVLFGGYYKWGVDNGKIVPSFLGPAYLDTLNFYRTAFKEQLINPDLATISANDMVDKFYKGKIGWLPAVAGVANGYELNLQKNVPNGKVGLAQLNGPQGIRTVGYTGNNGFYIFPKSSVKDEAELKRVLAFFDKLLDQKMADLTQSGIEGVDYKIVDGKAQMLDQDHFNKTVKMFTNGLPVDQTGGNRTPPLQRPLEEAASKMYKDNEPHLVKDATTGLFSQTYADKGADLDQTIHDADVKYITGNIDENAWKAVAEKWKKDGGDKIMAEFNDAYAKIANK